VGKVASPRAPTSQVERKKSPSKAEQRYEELGRKCIELEEEVAQLKERQAVLQAQIAEKETRIRMFRFAQDELYDTMEF
jgi:chromosome segregation ATPase